MRWRRSASARSTALAISSWPGRYSNGSGERARIPPGEKNSWSEGRARVEVSEEGMRNECSLHHSERGTLRRAPPRLRGSRGLVEVGLFALRWGLVLIGGRNLGIATANALVRGQIHSGGGAQFGALYGFEEAFSVLGFLGRCGALIAVCGGAGGIQADDSWVDLHGDPRASGEAL